MYKSFVGSDVRLHHNYYDDEEGFLNIPSFVLEKMFSFPVNNKVVVFEVGDKIFMVSINEINQSMIDFKIKKISINSLGSQYQYYAYIL